MGARIAPYGRWSRDLGRIDGVGSAVRVDHERHDVGGSLGLGRRRHEAEIAGLLLAGASLADTRAAAEGAPQLGSSSQTTAWIGAGLSMRYGLGAGLAVGLSLEVVWVPEPTRYLVRGTPALVEGPVRVRSALALRWGISP